MKKLADVNAAAANAAKHRKYHWCRRENGFSDLPIWRVVAARCNMPLYQVLAFVNRLEETANAAANNGQVRGSLESFDADEYGAALGMSADEAARLYAMLEDPKIGWISFDHVASFYNRNPDRDEDAEDVRNRKRRERSRKEVRKMLADLARTGKIAEPDRFIIEATLRGISDADLLAVQNRLARAALSTGVSGHVVTSRDIVTVTPEQTRFFQEAAVDNSGDGVRGEAVSSADEANREVSEKHAAATAWIDLDGLQKLVDYLQIRTPLAQTYIERWRSDVQDDEALAEILKGAEGAGYIGARFHTIVTDQIKRFLAKRANGPSLPLMPPRPGQRTTDSHNVTSAVVDNAKRNAS